MNRELLRLLGGSREIRRPGGYSLRVLTAGELLEVKAEVEEMCPEGAEKSLWSNACILARAVHENGKPVFSEGKALMDCWSGEKIAEEMDAYRTMAEDTAPELGQAKKLEAILQGLRETPMERIRWKVLRAFSVLPTEERAKKMTEGDYLFCAAQLLLDREEQMEKLCPECRESRKTICPGCGRELLGEQEQNPRFDIRRFEELKRHG